MHIVLPCNSSHSFLLQDISINLASAWEAYGRQHIYALVVSSLIFSSWMFFVM